MKLENPLKYWLTMFLILLFASLCLVGCKAKPIIQEQKEIITDSIKENNVKIELTEVTKEIKDSNAVKMPVLHTGQGKIQDSICNARYNEALETINFYKKSGANSYKTFFNKETRMLYTIAEMEEIINSKDSTIHELKNTKKAVKNTVQTVVKTVYPEWLVYLAIIGGLSIIFWIYRITLIFK